MSPERRQPQSHDRRGTNADMIARLLAAPAEEIPEGGYGLRLLTTAGRHTGRHHRTPVGVLRLDDLAYVVCPDRKRDWPRNLLADPECVVRIGAQRHNCYAVRITGNTAIEVVANYLSVVRAPWALRSFALEDPRDRGQIAAALCRFAIFRLDSRERADVMA